MNYFMSLDIKLTEVYGMSESSGVHSGNLPGKIKFGSVGVITDVTVKSKLVKVCRVKVVVFTKLLHSQSGDAEVTDAKELCMWGRHVMMGYAYREDATRKDMTEDGWLRTGDLVEIDPEGYHFIVGREKDLIITAGGENVAPQPIHDAVKAKLPVISQVLLLGDKKKFCSTFLTLAVEVDPDTMEPSSQLTPAALDWCR